MRAARLVQVFALAIAAVSLPRGSARAEGPAEMSDEDTAGYARSADRRTLGGHRFIPTAEVPWPFTITSLGSDLLIGVGTTSASVRIGDQTFSGSVDYAGIGGMIGYEYAFLDHFSARAGLVQVMYSGINGKSALTVGTQVQFGFDVGGTASMQLGDSVQLGLLLDVAQRPSLGLTIGKGLNGAIDRCQAPSGCSVDPGQLYLVQSVLTVQPAVAVSWAPFSSLGLTANVAYIQASATDRDSPSGSAMSLATAADFDFGAITSTHIGLLLLFSWTAPISGAGLQHVTDLGGGIMYTGRKNLSAGIQVVDRRFAVASNVDVSWRNFLATIGLRHYW